MADNSRTVDRLAAQIKAAHPSMSHDKVKAKARAAVLRTERPQPKKK